MLQATSRSSAWDNIYRDNSLRLCMPRSKTNADVVINGATKGSLSSYRTRATVPRTNLFTTGEIAIAFLRLPQHWHPKRLVWAGRALSFSAASIAAVLVSGCAPNWLVGTSRAVASYDAAAIVLIIMTWTFGMHGQARHTARRAAIIDPGRNAVFLIVFVSAIMGFISAIWIFGSGPHVANFHEKSVVYALGMAAMISGWWLIHTMFTFRYAHLFYFDGNADKRPDRGLTFPGTQEPNDYDFAYFSFVVGMTFQVSDVTVNDSIMRKTVLTHGLISFAYNTAILALGVNIVSGLIHS